MGGVMREYRKVVQTGEDSVNFCSRSWFLTFYHPFPKRLYTYVLARRNDTLGLRDLQGIAQYSPSILRRGCATASISGHQEVSSGSQLA